MIRRLLSFVAVVCLSSSVALAGGFSRAQDFRAATPEELAAKSDATWPGAAAAILDWLRVDDDRAATSAEYYRIKVFTAEGASQGNVELSYSPGYPLFGRITDISARTIRPDGSVVPFDGKVYDKVLVKVGRSSWRAKTFSLPDVQPGSIIEYRFIRRWSDRVLLNTMWSIQHDIPVVRAKFVLHPYDSKGEYSSFFTYQGLPTGKMPVRGTNGYELELENVPPFQRESFAPPEAAIAPRVNFAYTSSRVAPEQFWKTQPAIFAKEIEGFIAKKSSAAKEIAFRLTPPGTDELEGLRRIYADAQSMQNLSWAAGVPESELVESRTVEQVLRKRSGFSHEINRAFVAVARAAGYDASAVRVGPRDERFFSDKIPDPNQMSGEVAVVTVGGKPLYLDPGTPHAPFGIVSWEKSGVPGIQIAAGARATWVTLPQPQPKDAVMRRTADLRLEGENLEGTIAVTFTGQEALIRRLRAITDDEAARKKSIEDEVKGWFPDGTTLKLTSLSGASAHDEPLVAAFDVVLPNIVSQAGSRVVVPISIFASTATNPFAPATRTHPMYFPYQRMEEDEVRLTVPPALSLATVPPPSKLDVGALTYQNETSRDGQTITFRRSKGVSVMMIDAKHYSGVRKFYGAVASADQQPLVFVPGEAK